MISSLQNLFWPVANPKAAPAATARANRSTTSSVRSFRSLMPPAAKPTPATPAAALATPAAAPVKSAPAAPAPKPSTPGAKTGQADLPRLGPMTADPNTHPAGPGPQLPDPITSSPYMPPGFRGTVNLMNRAEHVDTMNAWLQNYTRWENDNRTQIYQQAMYNWQLNSQRCQELGIDPPPKPTPPALTPIQNMPAEYWFA
jgi:hypothetical protein